MHHTQMLSRKKILLALSIGLNVGLLAYFKYANFFIENINFALNETGSNTISWVEVSKKSK